MAGLEKTLGGKTLDPPQSNGSIFNALVFVGILSTAAHFLHGRVLAFLLLPLSLVFNRTPFRFLILLSACYFLFFQPFNVTSSFSVFSVPDSLVLSFVILAFFSREKPFTIKLPGSPPFLALYLFAGYVLILSIHSFQRYGLDVYVIHDVKNVLCLLLAPVILVSESEDKALKKVFLAFFAMILFSACYSLLIVLEFLVIKDRIITWNEISIADSVIISALLLHHGRLSRKIRFLTGACLILCTLGLLVTQTRGLWLSTAACLGLFFCGIFLKNLSRINFAALARRTATIVAVAAGIYVMFGVVFGVYLLDFIQHRLTAFDKFELIDPYSSVGYRIHESMAVWDKRTFFGHGPGARIYLYFTQLGQGKFMDWWSIHSGYLDLLHKYGFLGLGIFMSAIFGFMFQAGQISRARNSLVSRLGAIILLVFMNHVVVSVSSGYFFRDNVIVLLVLLIYGVEKVKPFAVRKASTASLGLEEREAQR